MKLGDLQNDLDAGKLLRRDAWPAGEFAFLVAGSTFAVNRAPLSTIFPLGKLITYRPHIDRAYVDGTIGYWTPTQDDIQATDWAILPPLGEPEPVTNGPVHAVWLIQANANTPVYTPRYWSAEKSVFIEDPLTATAYDTVAQAQDIVATLRFPAHVIRYARGA